MEPCTFCGRAPAVNFALTVLDGDPNHAASWRREVLPICPRCHRLLAKAGDEGWRVKTTGLRWWLGHGVGRFDLKATPATAVDSSGRLNEYSADDG